MGQRGLVSRIRLATSRCSKMLDVDAAGKREYMRMLVPLGLVQRVATGENHVCSLKQLRLATEQVRWRTPKGGQLVHAVVHGGQWLWESTREAQRHGRVVPEYELLDTPLDEEILQQEALDLISLAPAHPWIQPRYDDGDAGHRRCAQ